MSSPHRLLYRFFPIRPSQRRLRVVPGPAELDQAVLARDRFIDLASHELKTPLSALKLQIQLSELTLRRGGYPAFTEDRLRSLLDRTVRQCDRLERLIDHMLDASRISAGRFTIQIGTYLLDEIVRSALDRHAEELRKSGCDVAIELESGVLGRFDGKRVAQIVSSLASNAGKYAPGCLLAVRLRSEDGRARLHFRDFGPGVPMERQEAIFGRFERATHPNEASGLGLGLFISRAIARAHGGDLSILSAPGAGAEFVLDLPLSPAKAEPPRQEGLSPDRGRR